MKAYDKDYERGRKMRQKLLGADYVARSEKNRTPLTAGFLDLATKYIWGGLWTRPGLTLKQRSMVTMAIVAALKNPNELKLHIRGTRRTGVTKAEVSEILLHVLAYAGVPAGNQALTVAVETYKEMEQDDAAKPKGRTALKRKPAPARRG